MEFREAEPDDGGEIRGVALASLHATYDDILGEGTVEEAFDNWYDPDELGVDLESDDVAFFVAEESEASDETSKRRAGPGDESDVVGFAHVHVREEQDEGRIQWLHVHPDHRGAGVGSRLLEYARDALRARGLDHVSGEVLADNVAGNEFYRDHGFQLRDQYTVEAPEGTMYVDRTDAHRGKEAPWYPIYRGEDGTRRYGWFCGNCETANNAMDAMGRIECNECGNVRKPTRWDAAYL